MSKRWSLNFWNAWPDLLEYEHGRLGIIQFNLSWERGVYWAVDTELLGFGFALSRYRNGKHLVPAGGYFTGTAVGGYVDPDVLQAPVESLGREA